MLHRSEGSRTPEHRTARNAPTSRWPEDRWRSPASKLARVIEDTYTRRSTSCPFCSLLVDLRSIRTLAGRKNLAADFNLFGFCNIQNEQSDAIAFAYSLGKRLNRKTRLADVLAQTQPESTYRHF